MEVDAHCLRVYLESNRKPRKATARGYQARYSKAEVCTNPPGEAQEGVSALFMASEEPNSISLAVRKLRLSVSGLTDAKQGLMFTTSVSRSPPRMQCRILILLEPAVVEGAAVKVAALEEERHLVPQLK